MHRSTLAADLLDASVASCELFVERGSTRLAVPDLANHIGISVRTFHRYFATKADTLSPFFREKSRLLNEYVDSADAQPVRTFLLGAHVLMFGGAEQRRTRQLFPLVFADPEMWAVFLRALHEGDRALMPHLARRLHIPEDHPRSRVAASAFTSSNRIALETMVRDGRDSATVFADTIEQFGPTPFSPPSSDGQAWPDLTVRDLDADES